VLWWCALPASRLGTIQARGEFLIVMTPALPRRSLVAQFTSPQLPAVLEMPEGYSLPSLILGSALAGLVGAGERATIGLGSPATYALAEWGRF